MLTVFFSLTTGCGEVSLPPQHRSLQIGVLGRTSTGQDPGKLKKLSTKLKRPLSSATAA